MISDRIRKTDPYYIEMDKINDNINDNINTLETTMNTQITDLNTQIQNVADIQINKKPSYKDNWNGDVVFFYDFSDKNDLGKDVGDYNRNGINYSCEYFEDANRKNSLFLDKNIRPDDDDDNNKYGFQNAKYIDFSQHSNVINNITEYSLCGWLKPGIINANHMTAISFSNTLSNYVNANGNIRGNNFNIMITHDGSGNVMFRPWFNEDGNVLFLATYKINIAFDAWFHFCFQMSLGGNALYINGVLQTPTTYNAGGVPTGNALTYIPFSQLGINTCSIGGEILNKTYQNDTFGNNSDIDLIKFQYWGYISDVVMFSRILSQDEITKIYNDDYGYNVLILAGQSNMRGRATPIDGIDNDFTLHENRVFQFETCNNIDGTTYASTNFLIRTPSNDINDFALDWPYYPRVIESTMGMWKTFCDDYIQYSNIPYRKKLLLVPCASGGTGFKSNNWNPTNKFFEITDKAIYMVLNPSYNVSNSLNKCIGFFWIQGEQDIKTNNLNYETDYNNMIAEFKSRNPELLNIPIINAKINNSSDRIVFNNTLMKKFVNDVFYNLSLQNEDYGYVETNGLYTIDSSHYNIKSVRELGYRFYKKWCEITGNQYTKPKGVLNLDKFKDTGVLDLKYITLGNLRIRNNKIVFGDFIIDALSNTIYNDELNIYGQTINIGDTNDTVNIKGNPV